MYIELIALGLIISCPLSASSPTRWKSCWVIARLWNSYKANVTSINVIFIVNYSDISNLLFMCSLRVLYSHLCALSIRSQIAKIQTLNPISLNTGCRWIGGCPYSLRSLNNLLLCFEWHIKEETQQQECLVTHILCYPLSLSHVGNCLLVYDVEIVLLVWHLKFR